MAKNRKNVEIIKVYENWEEVDHALMEAAVALREIEKIEHEMETAIEKAKQMAAQKAQKHKDRLKEIEQGLVLFAEDNRNEFAEKKTKELNFGNIGYRKSTKLVLPRGKAKLEEIIAKIKERGMWDCIVEREEKIDKDVLKSYGEEEIKAVGAWLDVQDKFWYEPKREEVK